MDPMLIPLTNEHDGVTIVRVNVATFDVFGCLISSQVTPNVKVPVADGVPDKTPVFASNDRPAGGAPDTTSQLLYGGFPAVAVKVNEYGTVVTPPGRGLVEVIMGFCGAAYAIITIPDMMNNMNNEIIYFLKCFKCILPLANCRS
jgi:hypothetical protein